MIDEKPQDAAAQFWDQQSVAPTHVNWMGDQTVRDYINESISGSPHIWPISWFLLFLGERRFDRALSIGCGTGPLERDLVRRGICRQLDAFDGSPGSIEVARTLADEEGFGDRIHYYIDDFNEPQLPRNAYDAVFFHQSLHHVAKLEKLMSAILRTLRSGGLLYIDEYMGPSRFDWNDALIAPHQALFARIPAEARLCDPLPLPIQPDDPSEAVRSSEILPQLARGFRLLVRRDYGGTILSVLYPMIDWRLAPESLLCDLIVAEKQALARGLPPYHAIVVATPKRPPKSWLALLGYFLTPKVRRIRWEIRKRLHRGEEVGF